MASVRPNAAASPSPDPAALPPAARSATLARIVVATDGSPLGDRAVEWAREIALMGRPEDRANARIFVLHAILPARDHDRDVLDVALRALGPTTHAEPVLAFGEPAHAIARLANDVRADLVIVGSHGRNALERIVLGSVSDRVKDEVRTSLLIARTPAPPRRILLADDGSPVASAAGEVAVGWTRGWRVPLSITRAFPTLATRAGAAIAAAARDLGADLIIVGSRERGRSARAVSGSVGAHLAHHAPASLLIVKRSGGA